jgi:hypothetical protein
MIIQSNIRIKIVCSPTKLFTYFSSPPPTHTHTHIYIYSLSLSLIHPSPHILIHPSVCSLSYETFTHTLTCVSTTHHLLMLTVTQSLINVLNCTQNHSSVCSLTLSPNQYHMIPVICMQRHLNSSW